MKNQLIDRFSKVGRLQARLEEIVAKADAGEMTCMDAGDEIGRQIVAYIEAQPNPDGEHQLLHCEAQLTRGILYQRSTGATPLEAAEALEDAYRLMCTLSQGQDQRDRIVDAAWQNYADLLKIGSRRTSWSMLQVLFSATKHSEEHSDLRPDLVCAFADLAGAFDEDCEIDGAIALVLELSDWARSSAPEAFRKLLDCLPQLLSVELERIDTNVALQAFLFGSKNDTELDTEIFENLVRRLVDDGRRDTEARVVYRAFLENHPENKTTVEPALRRLGHVHPDPTFAYNPELDRLNQLCAEFYGTEAIWPWRNCALMMRRKSDLVGAVACLARAMSISGEPPDLIGLLSPVLYRMGFKRSAKEFARFAPVSERQRFRLRTLDLLEAVPRTEKGAAKMVTVLRRALRDEDLPPEFQVGIRKRIAELSIDLKEYEVAYELLSSILEDDPSDELAAVRIAEVEVARGRIGKARAKLTPQLSARVRPWVCFIKSLIAECDEDVETAQRLTSEGIDLLEDAQAAGRDMQQKSLKNLQQRVQKSHGDAVANGPLLAMLETDVFDSRHEDLVSLRPKLEQRRLDLSLKGGDLEKAREAYEEIASSREESREVLINGLRTALKDTRQEEADFFMEQLAKSDDQTNAELERLRAIHASRWGDPIDAVEGFCRALELGDGAPSTLALATILAERGDEAQALSLLDDWDERSEGEATTLRSILQLRGILLERSGDRDQARELYHTAARLGKGWHEARRRAGLLGLQRGITDGKVHLIEESLACLEGFRDPESVIAETRARASLSKTPREAASIYETALKRLDEKHRSLLDRLRLPHLLESGDFEEAEAIATKLLEEEAGEQELETSYAGVLAWLKRRRIVDALFFVGPTEGPSLESMASDLAATESLESVRCLSDAVDIMRALARKEPSTIVVGDKTHHEIVLAAALTGSVSQQHPSVGKALTALSKNSTWPELAALSTYRLGVEGANDGSLDRDAAEQAAFRLGARLPYDEASIRRLQAIRSAAAGGGMELEEFLHSGVEGFEDLALCLELSDLCQRTGGVDANRLTRGLSRLVTRVSNPVFSDSLREIQRTVSRSCESPSPVWASARMRTAGKRARAFLPAVLEFWEAQELEGDPSPDCLHWIALLSTAAAHEGEAVGREEEDYWRQAHAAWSKVFRCDAFWDQLVEEGHPEAARRVRARLPGWVVFAHIERARFYLQANKLAHAMRHARYATQSPLAEEAGIPQLHEKVFDLFAADHERLLQRKRFAEALENLDHVLLADPENAHASREMIRVAAEGLRQALGMIDALRNEPDEATLQELTQMMRPILTYAERGVERALEQDDIDPVLAEDLVVCLRGMAFVRRRGDGDIATAGQLVDKALEIAPSSSRMIGPLRKLRADLGLAMVDETLNGNQNVSEDSFQSALVEIERLCKLDPDNRSLQREHSRLLMVNGRADEAEESARRLYDIAKDMGDAGEMRAAVELLNEVQKGRADVRLDGQLGVVERLIEERNWRTALQVFRDASVGHENEANFIAKHIEILLGLHKVRKVEEELPYLDGFANCKEISRRLRAQLCCLKYMSAKGGDIYAAFELYERSEHKRALNILLGLAPVDTQDLGAQTLTAICKYHLEGEEDSAELVDRVSRIARGREEFWVLDLIEWEKMR